MNQPAISRQGAKSQSLCAAASLRESLRTATPHYWLQQQFRPRAGGVDLHATARTVDGLARRFEAQVLGIMGWLDSRATHALILRLFPTARDIRCTVVPNPEYRPS